MARYDPVHVVRSGVIMPRLRPRAKQIMRQPFPPLMAAAVSAVVSVGASQLLQLVEEPADAASEQQPGQQP
jgi:hypothetical protein